MIRVLFTVFLFAISAVRGYYLLSWIDHGGICETAFGEVLQCIHPNSCYPKYTEFQGRPQICGLDDTVTIMCCVEDTVAWSIETSSEDDFPTTLNEQFPCGSSTQNQSNVTKQSKNKGGQTPVNNNGTDENSLDPEQNNSNAPDISKKRIDDEQAELAATVAQNVTINFPFYAATPENSTSFRKCTNFYPRRTIYPIIVRGRDARPREFRHMAALGYGNEDNIQWLCGGSLISEQFVLTAAHCRIHEIFKDVKFVKLGALNINNITETDARTFGVESFISHPLYKAREKYHDIALIKLNTTVFFSESRQPACLATRWDLTNITLNATGWGLTEYLGEPASILQTAALQYVSNERCRSIYRNSRKLRAGIIETLQICADGGSARRDSCRGDSGGPLQFENNFNEFDTFPEIAGITSHGIECGLTAGVYTRVLPYVPWIESIVWPNE